MILKRLLIENFRPFNNTVTLNVDSAVTVLTGQNDVGKSSILHLIEVMYTGKQIIEDDVNIARHFDANIPWDQDPHVRCTAIFELRSGYQSYFHKDKIGLNPGTEILVNFSLALHKTKVEDIQQGSKSLGISVNDKLQKLPKLLYVSSDTRIGPTVHSNTNSGLEQKFLELAFGENPAPKLLKLSRPVLDSQIRAATAKINTHLNTFLPHSLGLEFAIALEAVEEESISFNIGFRDKHGGDTPIHYRGSGIQKIVSLMIELMNINVQQEQILILLDEPENSLHADAQHMFRAFLEGLAQHETIQVIYATHSPSMINSYHTRGLRLLERIQESGRATTRINNRPFDDNFVSVRTNLGITPADSLLYAPITLICEGPTEITVLPFLLKRLHDADIIGFENVPHLFSLTHIINGNGDSFDKWCRMAVSQGSKCVIFVDGDKIRRVGHLQKNGKLDGIPVIHLKDNTEFEDIVDKDTYFKALAEVVDQDISREKYTEWETTANLHEKLMFSKRIDLWLRCDFPDADYHKPTVMEKAIELAEPSEIETTEILQLVQIIDELLKQV